MDFAIIAISGKAQSGKTTSKDIIKKIITKNYPDYKVVILPFAQKLKDIAEDLFGWDGDKNLYYKETVVFNTSSPDTVTHELIEDQGRQLLINLGKKMREIRSAVWADYVAKQIISDIKNDTAHKKIYIIDDLRFKNEIKSLERFGTKLITLRINRREQLTINDISEIDLDDFINWNYYINNNFDINTLEEQLTPVTVSAYEASLSRVHDEF